MICTTASACVCVFLSFLSEAGLLSMRCVMVCVLWWTHGVYSCLPVTAGIDSGPTLTLIRNKWRLQNADGWTDDAEKS